MPLKTLTSLDPATLEGKRVLVRASMNVPLADGKVEDDFRLRRAIPTIHYLQKHGAKTILVGHLGRDPKETFLPVAKHLQDTLGLPVQFIPQIFGEEAEATIRDMRPGEVVLLENLRQHPGEKANDPEFSKQLAAYGELYVSDAFSVAHREHASIIGVPQYLPSVAGLLFEDEYMHMIRAKDPKHPFLLILGGAKFETKEPLLREFMGVADDIFLAGALAHTILRARGYSIGRSLVGERRSDEEVFARNEKLHTPVDVVVKRGAGQHVCGISEVEESDVISDAGEETVEFLRSLVSKAKFILWNGPLGNYEEGFDQGTKALLSLIAESNAEAYIGGGDTVALVTKMGLEDKFTFVSTAGGAMLDFLVDGDVPGIHPLFADKAEPVSA